MYFPNPNRLIRQPVVLSTPNKLLSNQTSDGPDLGSSNGRDLRLQRSPVALNPAARAKSRFFFIANNCKHAFTRSTEIDSSRGKKLAGASAKNRDCLCNEKDNVGHAKKSPKRFDVVRRKGRFSVFELGWWLFVKFALWRYFLEFRFFEKKGNGALST